jgi:hypothetical protein
MMIVALVFVCLLSLTPLVSAQNNNEIIDTCEDEQWTLCNESYRKCQMKVNASPCPCFRTLLDCGDVTGCLSGLQRDSITVACEALCPPSDCNSAASLAASLFLTIAAFVTANMF